MALRSPSFAFAEKKSVPQSEAENACRAYFFEVVLMIVLQHMFDRFRRRQGKRGEKGGLEARHASKLSPPCKKTESVPS